MQWSIYKGIGLLFVVCFFMGCENKETTTTQSTLTTPSTASIQTSAYTDQVPWVKDLDTAFTLSQTQNKILIVMVESHGCRWCEKMEEETLNNPKVLQKLNEFIMVKVLRENPDDRSRLPEFKHVPIMFFYQPDGELFDNLRGYFEAEDFLEYLNELS